MWKTKLRFVQTLRTNWLTNDKTILPNTESIKGVEAVCLVEPTTLACKASAKCCLWTAVLIRIAEKHTLKLTHSVRKKEHRKNKAAKAGSLHTLVGKLLTLHTLFDVHFLHRGPSTRKNEAACTHIALAHPTKSLWWALFTQRAIHAKKWSSTHSTCSHYTKPINVHFLYRGASRERCKRYHPREKLWLRVHAAPAQLKHTCTPQHGCTPLKLCTTHTKGCFFCVCVPNTQICSPPHNLA